MVTKVHSHQSGLAPTPDANEKSCSGATTRYKVRICSHRYESRGIREWTWQQEEVQRDKGALRREARDTSDE